MKAAVLGCSGLTLREEERQFFAEQEPVGFILFGRNIQSPEQVQSLVGALKDCVAASSPLIMIDQEGGRVARLRPPHWSIYPPAAQIGALYAQNNADGEHAAHLLGRLIGGELAALGVNVDCAPVLDVYCEGAHDIIGDRAFGDTAETVARLGRKMGEGLMNSGVLPVIKHIPGHGRAGVDSHKALPIVDTSIDILKRTDFAAFRNYADAPMAMTAHVIYSAIDPENPATISKTVLGDIVRDDIGFNGLLMSDDLSMKALKGDLKSRTRAAIEAGCDVALHCNGDLSEMSDVVAACSALSSQGKFRLDRALSSVSKLDVIVHDDLMDTLNSLLKGVADHV
ncbi:MAG: beta-N-acetylhexosaminidase [Alphaproteobacteria bacterium]|jgi:beta-N-acetylhexosaminidase